MAYVTAGSLDLNQLAQFQFSPQLQSWAFPVLFLGFAVLAGIWPLHTWAPTGHAAAPTAGSMLLAGIVMKLGAYAGLRVAMNLFPQGFQMWSKWIAVLAVIGIVYAAAVALRQRDLKFVIGYSSVSHMGFVLLGLATANVLERFRRGPANVFAWRDRRPAFCCCWTHDLSPHTHSRSRRPRQNESEPRTAVCGVHIRNRIGRVDGHPRFQRVCGRDHNSHRRVEDLSGGGLDHGAGMVLVAAFTLRALKQSFFGETGAEGEVKKVTAATTLDREECNPITLAEKLGACLLMFTTLVVGVYPKLLLDRIMPAVETMRFLKSGG